MESFFDEKTARKELRRYIKRGAEKATRTIIDVVRPLTSKVVQNGSSGFSLLDIGGGIGTIPLELMSSGIERVTNVDASHGYQRVAREIATSKNVNDRITFVDGDFVDVASGVAVHDIVTLDKVVCCYPNVIDLVQASAQRARKYYVLSYPRNLWYTRAFIRIASIGMKFKKSAFRPYIHTDEQIQDILVGEGFALINEERMLFWQVRVWERV